MRLYELQTVSREFLRCSCVVLLLGTGSKGVVPDD